MKRAFSDITFDEQNTAARTERRVNAIGISRKRDAPEIEIGGVDFLAAAQHREPVVETAGDLGHRHDPDPRGSQLHGERQPVQAGAQLADGLRGQIGVGPGVTP